MTVATSSKETHASGLYIALLGIWLIATMSLWGLAFFHLPEATPEWVLRAQSACFGTNENGLPDGYGWMVLILSPLSFLIAMFVVFRNQVAEDFKLLIQSLPGKFLLTLVSLTVLAQAAWVTSRISEGIAISNTDYTYSTSEELPETYPRLNQEAAAFDLVDHKGNKVNLESLKGRVVFITFAFAHCKTICPSIVKSVSNTQDKLSDLPLSSLIVTLDPWRDTPNNISSQAERWKLGENTHFLSGNVDSVLKVLDDYSVSRERDMKTGDVTHPALVYVLDTQGKIAYAFNNPYPSWLESSVKRLLEEHV
ncbi:MAG: SCO family protein [Bdellovibrionota bacterium]